MSMQHHTNQQHQQDFTGAFDKVAVKQERPDEAEIRELAAKMVEANKAKVAASGIGGQSGQRGSSGIATGQPNLPGILGYLTSASTTSPLSSSSPLAANNATSKSSRAGDSTAGTKSNEGTGKVPLDDESQRGHFGWITFDKCHIPYIYRAGEKYCSVRILESKLLNKYLSYLHSDIYSCTCIKSYYITEAESKLFNEINMRHCEGQFGKEQFTVKDLVVRVADAKEFYTFLDVCYTKLTAGQNATNSTSSSNTSSSSTGIKSEKCGFIRINKESVVPYTVKDNLKYVPLFYFEGETDNLKLKAEKLEGWDLSYLKFCCKVQGIRNELFASETCSVISLSDIKSYFPPGTGFEDYWPSKVMDSQLFVSSKGGSGSGGWTKQPPTPPIVKNSPNVNQASAPNASKNSLNSRVVTSLPGMAVPRAGNVNNNVLQQQQQQQQQQVNQQRQTSSITTHPSHLSPNTVSSVRSSNSAHTMLNVVPTLVNGWSGLVGGQPTFQTAPLVSQPNPIIRMQNSSLGMHNQIQTTNKSYQQQQQQSRSRPSSSGAAPTQYSSVYPTTTIQPVPQAQPPPLVRATVHSSQPSLGYPTYGKDDWGATTYTTPSLAAPNAVSASTYPQMFNLSSEHVQALLHPATSASNLMSHTQRHTPPVVHNSSHPKFPPALIPVNGSSNSTRDSRVRNQLNMIAETVTTNCQVQPYGLQKALVEGKMVPCINFKPYNFKEMLLMTLPDFVSQYFPACEMNSCRHVLTDVLGIELYQGNRSQMKVLMDAGKCASVNEELPLIQVSSIMKYMPQMKYMFNRNIGMTAPAHLSSEEHPAKKRQRTS